MAGFNGATGVPLKQMQDAIAQSTAITTVTYNGTTTAAGIIVTTLDYSNNIVNAMASDGSGIYYCAIRRSLSNKIVGYVYSESGAVVNTSVTLVINKIGA